MSNLKKGLYSASIESLKMHDGRYFLHLKLLEANIRIKIDIHDYIHENLGCHALSKDNITKVLYGLPSTIKISNLHGSWEICNESFILSQAFSKIAF